MAQEYEKDVPTHWYGQASSFSRVVARASGAVHRAEEAMLDAMRSEYPKGCEVRVVHHRGAFVGHVQGWDKFGCRVIVHNDRTGKTSKWWAAQVERTTCRPMSALGVSPSSQPQPKES